MSDKTFNVPLRGVLLDLAREKDSLESVFEFFDFIKKYNYNTEIIGGEK